MHGAAGDRPSGRRLARVVAAQAPADCDMAATDPAGAARRMRASDGAAVARAGRATMPASRTCWLALGAGAATFAVVAGCEEARWLSV